MKESVIEFGDEQRLVGTLLTIEPTMRSLSSTGLPIAVLTFNAGLIPRTGPHRIWVSLARKIGHQGVCSLRFDLSGQGDSRAAASMQAFETQSIEDICQAMAAVQEKTGIERFILIGICSGGVLSYQAALEDERIIGCAMIDPYMYTTARTFLVRMQERVRREGYLPVIKGAVHALKRKLGVFSVAASIAKPPSALPGLARPEPEDYAAGLQKLLDRKTKIWMIYTGSYLYKYNYKEQFNDYFKRFKLTGPLVVDFETSIDHTVTEKSSQAFVVNKMADWIKTF
jgi:pimeloyl-ACP methyl ester carboxylesterase